MIRVCFLTIFRAMDEVSIQILRNELIKLAESDPQLEFWFTGCYNRPGAKVTNGMTVYCKDGTLEYALRSTLDIYTAEGQTHMDRGEEQTGIMDRVFIDAIKTGDGSKIRSPYSDAIKSLKLTMACEESAKTGEVIKL